MSCRWSSNELQVEHHDWPCSMRETAVFEKGAAGSSSGSAASEGSELQVDTSGAAGGLRWSSSEQQ